MKFHWSLALLVVVAMTTVRAEDDDEEADVAADVEVEEFKPPTPTGPTYFHEAFLTEDVLWKKWVKSEAKKDDVEDEIARYDGEWAVESAEEGSLKGDLGLVLKTKAKHHAVAVKLDRPFEFEESTFIAQYEVKFQNGLECGGAYIKLLAEDPDLESFQDKTRYTIMFGPDKCGSDSKLHFIFQHKNPITGNFEEKHAKKPSGFSHVFTDKKSHLFTLIIQPDNTFEILVDQKSVSSGSLLDDFTPPVNPPAEIEDPEDFKPEDWDDRKKIPDPDATKPDDWDEDAPARIPDPDAVKPEGWLDSEPELIDDPDAEKPDDWDEDLDGEWEPPQVTNPACEDVGCGEWEPPMVNNPDFKGKWKPAMIDNPDYSGEWKAKIVPNPDFFEDLEPFKMSSIGAIGLELWSMTDNIYFDNFIITSERAVADNWADDTWRVRKKAEGSDSYADSAVSSFMKTAEEKPWIWVVVGLVVIIPLFLCFRLCFGGSKSEEDQVPADSKKSDEPSASGDQEGEGGEEGEEAEKEEEPEEGVRQRKKQSKKADLEEASQEEDEGEAAAAEEEKKGESPSVRKSPRQKSRKD